jgi:transposase
VPGCGIAAVIPVKEDQKKHRRDRGRAGGRPPVFDPGWYKKRNTVERCFSKLKQFRAVATRYDKRERIYQAPSTSHRSASGYAIPSHDPQDTPWRLTRG